MPEMKKCFDKEQDTETIVADIVARKPNFKFVEGETLVFFDEIQKCKNALSSLKTLVKEGKYDFICSGSLITFKIQKKDFFPVGSIQHEIMHPLDIEEFF
jgi:predicted AAA+ superfamily ATPase